MGQSRDRGTEGVAHRSPLTVGFARDPVSACSTVNVVLRQSGFGHRQIRVTHSNRRWKAAILRCLGVSVASNVPAEGINGGVIERYTESSAASATSPSSDPVGDGRRPNLFYHKQARSFWTTNDTQRSTRSWRPASYRTKHNDYAHVIGRRWELEGFGGGTVSPRL